MTRGFLNSANYARQYIEEAPTLAGIRHEVIEFYMKQVMKMKTIPTDDNGNIIERKRLTKMKDKEEAKQQSRPQASSSRSDVAVLTGADIDKLDQVNSASPLESTKFKAASEHLPHKSMSKKASAKAKRQTQLKKEITQLGGLTENLSTKRR